MPLPARAPSLIKPLKLRTQPLLMQVGGGALALVFAAMLGLLVTTFLIQVTRVNGPSMEPTLENRDCLLVDRLSYEFGTPQPGDIVTLYYPADPDRVFIKRVIAAEHQSVRSSTAASRSTGRLCATTTSSRRFAATTTGGPNASTTATTS